MAIKRSTETSAERFARFVLERDAARNHLTEAAAAAGLTMDASVESLRPLWEWLAGRLRTKRRWATRRNDPSWVAEGHPADALDAESVALLDGLMSYLRDVFHAETGFDWELEASDPSSVTYLHFVLDGGRFVPLNVVNAALRRWSELGEGDEQLMYWVGATVANTKAAAHSESQPLDVAADPSEVDGFHWHVWVDELAESVLGTEAYESLEGRMAAIPGVERVVHEDREVFLVEAPSIDRDALVEAVRALIAQEGESDPG